MLDMSESSQPAYCKAHRMLSQLLQVTSCTMILCIVEFLRHSLMSGQGHHNALLQVLHH